MFRWTKAAFASAIPYALASCALMQEPESCRLGEQSCDGREIRTCVVDVEAVSQAQTDRTSEGTWSTTSRCDDDPLLGPVTCGVVEGRPACVRSPRDAGPDRDAAGALTPGRDAMQWLRVTVQRGGGNQFQVRAIEPHTLRLSPLTAWQGTVAVVSYADDEILDAALVSFPNADVTERSVWVRGTGATRITIEKPDGTVTATHSRSSGPGAVTRQALAPQGHTLADLALPVRIVPEDLPPTLVEVLRPALEKLPKAPLSLVEQIEIQVDVYALALAAKMTPADVASLRANGPAPEGRPGNWVRHESLDAARLTLRLGLAEMEAYIKAPNALTRELARAVGTVYAAAAKRDSEFERATLLTEEMFDVVYEEYPTRLGPFFTARVAPLLAAGENLEDAWKALQSSAAQAGAGKPFSPVDIDGVQLDSDAAALAAGFASAAGSRDPMTDLSDYLASVAMGGAYGPCALVQSAPVNQLNANALLHLAKLTALRGLGLVTAEQLELCTGKLTLEGPEPGLVFHKISGEQLPFTEEFNAIYQPFFDGQVHISWVAHRGYLSTSLDLGFRGDLFPTFRLAPQAGSSGRDLRKGNDGAAVLAVNNPVSYQAIGATGGMVTPIEISPERLTAVAFFVTLSEPLWGETIYPLVTASSFKTKSSPGPLWGDAP